MTWKLGVMPSNLASCAFKADISVNWKTKTPLADKNVSWQKKKKTLCGDFNVVLKHRLKNETVQIRRLPIFLGWVLKTHPLFLMQDSSCCSGDGVVASMLAHMRLAFQPGNVERFGVINAYIYIYIYIYICICMMYLYSMMLGCDVWDMMYLMMVMSKMLNLFGDCWLWCSCNQKVEGVVSSGLAYAGRSGSWSNSIGSHPGDGCAPKRGGFPTKKHRSRWHDVGDFGIITPHYI